MSRTHAGEKNAFFPFWHRGQPKKILFFLPQSISRATPRFPGFFFDVNFLYYGGGGKGGFVGSQRRRMRKKKKILISIGKGFGGGGTSQELPKVERGRKKEREWQTSTPHSSEGEEEEEEGVPRGIRTNTLCFAANLHSTYTTCSSFTLRFK